MQSASPPLQKQHYAKKFHRVGRTLPSPQHFVRRQPVPSAMTQKVQLIYKLFLLENARNTLEQELLNFTSQAYEEVQGFFDSSFPTGVFSDLAKALDSKCQALNKLSVLLKDLTVEPHICVKNRMRTDKLQPLGIKGILMTDVVKFGPMLQNSLMASSITKAAQVLGAALPLQQVKHFLIPQPVKPVAVQQDMICSIVSSDNSHVVTKSSSSHFRAEEKEHAVVSKEKSPTDDVIFPSAVIQSPKISAGRPSPLQSSTQATFPKISNRRPTEITPLISWGCVGDVQVHHQKLTSSQLLHFLRAKAKNTGALNVTAMDWNNRSSCNSSSPQSMLPTVKKQRYQFRSAMTDDLTSAEAPKMLSTDIENQAPIFRVKRVESSGSLIFTCVIATKTELWDIGDIFTEVGEGDSEDSRLENEDCRNITVNIHRKSQTLPCTEPEYEDNSGTKTPVFNNITIPEFQIQRFEETEVVVSHIVDPGNFYVQQADSTAKLQALVTGTLKASSSYAEQNCIPDIGTRVMGWFHKQEQWCRAQVTKICGVSGDHNATDGAGSGTSITVEVRRLDHGDTACLSLWKIKQLPPEVAILPLQAVQVSLANVVPVNGSDWSEEAVCWFQAMVRNRRLYARLYPQGPKVTVELFLEKGKLGAMRRGASISLRLAQNGHAKHSKLRNDGLMKKCAFQDKTRKQDSEWEKYLISCYTQSRK